MMDIWVVLTVRLFIINNTAINIMAKFLLEYLFSFVLGTHLGVKLLGHRLTLCLTF